MIRLIKHFARRFGREDGNASVEFVLVAPLLLMVFMAAFESGLLMTRSIMLEQALDKTMRELRLGHYTLPDSNTLKSEICKRTVIFTNCQANITIEMTRVSTVNWAMPNTNVKCIDRAQEFAPVVAYVTPQQNDVMIVRVCVIQDALFPTTGLGLALPKDGQGGYGIVAVTAFATEPT
jgi:Flp pilus assembly protein TadG